MNRIAAFFRTLRAGVARPTFFSFIVILVLFAGIILNYIIEGSVHRSVEKHTTDAAHVLQIVQFKQQIDQVSCRLVEIEQLTQRYLLTPEPAIQLQLEEKFSLVQQDRTAIQNQGAQYVPRYLVTLYLQAVRNRLDFHQQLLQITTSAGHHPSLIYNSDEHNQLQLAYAKAAAEITGTLNTRVTYLNSMLAADESANLRLDRNWNIISLVFLILIAGTVLHQTARIHILNKQISEAAEQTKEAGKLKEQFMTHITHELRTPLNAVIGYTNLLLKQGHTGDTRKWINAVHSSGTMLLDIVNDVLDLSKLDSGFLRLHPRRFRLQEVITSVQNIIANRAEARNLRFEIIPAPDLPRWYFADDKKLKQILINLAGNAVKFTEEGSVTIAVSIVSATSNTCTLSFKVTDTGIGMSEQHLGRVFDRFYQIENNVSGSYAGTGLGLPIVKQLVELLGGSINVASTPGVGTTFTCLVPLQLAVGDERKEFALTPVRSISNLLHSKVLVVDDHELNRELMTLMLQSHQCTVFTAGTGVEAIRLLKEHEMDLVFMDVQMPEMNGIEAAHIIRNQMVLEVPIIACTAFSRTAEQQACAEAGMNDYLSKPFDEQQLLQLLRKHLPAPATPGLVNYQQIYGITGSNKELAASMIARAIEYIPNELEQLEQSLKAAQYTEVKERSHTMCSTLGLMGASNELIGEVKQMHYLCKEPQPDAAQLMRIFTYVQSTVHQMISELKEYLAA